MAKKYENNFPLDTMVEVIKTNGIKSYKKEMKYIQFLNMQSTETYKENVRKGYTYIAYEIGFSQYKIEN